MFAIFCLLACHFCDHVPEQGVGESAHAFVEVPYKSVVEGHLLIAPKRHVEFFEALTAEEVVEMHALIQKARAKALEVLGPHDYLLLQKNGEGAGQSVPHVHIHYLPRMEGTAAFLWRFLTRPYGGPDAPEVISTYQEHFTF